MTGGRSLLFTTGGEVRHSHREVDRSGTALEPSGAARPDLGAIYDEHLDFVWRSLLRLGVAPGAVEDAVQDVFLVVHRQLGGFQGRSTLRTWLFGIALRVAREHRRRGKKHGPPSEPCDEQVDERAPDPAEAAALGEARALLHALLLQLTEERRAVFILSEIEGMTAPEIAAGLDVNVNTLASRLRAARKDFDAALARHRARSAFGRRAR